MAKLTSMINIGKEMEKKLKSIDICSAEELIEIGSKEAFSRLKLQYSNLCLVHLYTLQGVIDSIEYSKLSNEIKANLKSFNDNLKLNILAESNHYIIVSEYETVTLIIKQTQKRVVIGDFYGDPDMAIISDDEKICAMCGCGVIIYYLKEPFQEYEYNTTTSQWQEWGRVDGVDNIWVESISFFANQYIEAVMENGDIIKLNI